MSVSTSLEPGALSQDPGTGQQPPIPVTVIQPSGRWPRLNLTELWAYRGLFFFLVWRDIKVRYAQTILGAGWAILQPVLTMLVFTVIFGNFAGIPSDGVPYAVFSLTALVPWTYFSTALSTSSGSLVSNKGLLTKVYFPRLVIPLAPVLAALVDMAIAMVILLITMAAFGIWPTWHALVLLPLLIVCMMMTATGVGTWLTGLDIQYRDVKHVVPFLVNVWMYASPIVYPMSMIPERYRLLYALNPMAGVIEGFRAVLLGTQEVDWSLIGFSLGVGFVIFLSGIYFFRNLERRFADVA